MDHSVAAAWRDGGSVRKLRRTTIREANRRMPQDWSREEVEAAVADYFAMLLAERSGVEYNKAEHRRALIKLLNG